MSTKPKDLIDGGPLQSEGELLASSGFHTHSPPDTQKNLHSTTPSSDPPRSSSPVWYEAISSLRDSYSTAARSHSRNDSAHTTSGSSVSSTGSVKYKYSLFPPPEPVIPPNLPLLMAARALHEVRSVPNFEGSAITLPNIAKGMNSIPSTPSRNSEASINEMKKSPQHGDHKKERSVSAKLQEKFKRLLSKKSSARIVCTEDGYCVHESPINRDNSVGHMSSRSISVSSTVPDSVCTEDETSSDKENLPEIAFSKTRPKVIRRVRSQADFSPRASQEEPRPPLPVAVNDIHSTSRVTLVSNTAIGDPPRDLPPMPPISVSRPKLTKVDEPLASYPPREDSLHYGNLSEEPPVVSGKGYLYTPGIVVIGSTISLSPSLQTSFMDSNLETEDCREYSGYAESGVEDGIDDSTDDIARAYSCYSVGDGAPDIHQEVYDRRETGEAMENAETKSQLSCSIDDVDDNPAYNSQYDLAQSTPYSRCQSSSAHPESRGNSMDSSGTLERALSEENDGHGRFLRNFLKHRSEFPKDNSTTFCDSSESLPQSETVSVKNRLDLTAFHSELHPNCASETKVSLDSVMSIAEHFLGAMEVFMANIEKETRRVQESRKMMQDLKSRLDEELLSAKKAHDNLEREKQELESEKRAVLQQTCELESVISPYIPRQLGSSK